MFTWFSSKGSNKSVAKRNLIALYSKISNQYSDRTVLEAVRSLVPTNLTKSANYEGKQFMIKALLDWFKNDFMGWTPIDPVCENCSSNAGSRVPVRVEITGGSSWKMRAMEIHSCNVCGHRNLFPRYGEILKIAAARTGRCTEWSALFGAITNSLGMETRIVHDFLDHCWNEITIDSIWVHLDCTLEYPISFNHPYYYEQNWGKKYEYVLAFFGEGHMDDVTQRYTQNWDLISRRRGKSPAFYGIFN